MKFTKEQFEAELKLTAGKLENNEKKTKNWFLVEHTEFGDYEAIKFEHDNTILEKI